MTVVVPTLDEESTIRPCLDAVLAQDYPADRVEVLVLDGGSRDRTRELVAEVAARDGSRVRLLANPGRTTPAALNLALAEARGDFFVRVDAHSVPAPHYLSACVRGNLEHDAVLAGGWVEATGRTPFGRAVAAAFASPFAMGNAVSWKRPAAPVEVASVPCGSYRVSALRAIGGFDEAQRANQDYEANYRLRRAGGRLVILPDVSFAYVPRDTPARLARQFLRYGYYKARVMVKHRESIRPRHLVPAAALALGVALAAAAPFSAAARLALVVLAILYALGLLAATVLSARSARGAALLLPLVFLTMHAAWALGNAAGLAVFVARRRELRRPLEPSVA